jgi:hypothetical protein
MRLAEHVTGTKTERDVYEIFVGNLQHKRTLWITRGVDDNAM